MGMVIEKGKMLKKIGGEIGKNVCTVLSELLGYDSLRD